MKIIKMMVILVVALSLAACQGGKKDAPPETNAALTLTSTVWQWVEFTNPVEQFELNESQNYLVHFKEDGSLNVLADCNRGMGDYSDDQGALSVGPIAATRALCPGDSKGEDFIKYLAVGARYFFQDGDLFIDLMADGGTMRLSAFAGGMPE